MNREYVTMTIQRLRTKVWLCWAVRVVPTYWRVLAWLLWLPHRRLRRSLFQEFADWGTPLRTLRAMSSRLESTHRRWEEALKRNDALEAEKRELKWELIALRSIPMTPAATICPSMSPVVGPFYN